MKLSGVLVVVPLLLAALNAPLPAQEEVPVTKEAARADAFAALAETQAALHAAENAQLELLRLMRSRGDYRPALRALDRAVKALVEARRGLKEELLRGDSPDPRAKVAKEPEEPREFEEPRRPPWRAEPPGRKDRARTRAIDLGLKWLSEHQDENGRWDCDGFMKHDKKGKPCDGAGNAVHDVGVTGLALLAFLGDGSTMRAGPYKDVVKKAVNWLKEQQGKNGLFGTISSHDFIYDHAIAAFAICEAQGLSESRILKRTAQGGINYLESHRNPYAVWRYQPHDNDNDTSITSWCIMAYRSATDFKLEVNDNALKIAAAWLDEMTDPVTGRTGYTKRGECSSRHPGDHSIRFPPERGEALTAAGLSGRFLLGQDPKKTEIMKRSADRILKRLPNVKEPGSIDHYFWFHGTQAMSQMGGRYAQRWSRALTPVVLTAQRTDGNFKGSWDSRGVWGADGGRVYSTALMLLALEASLRYPR